MNTRVVLMTKLPVPGTVKTRLIPALGADRAARLHHSMLLDTLDKVASTGLPCTIAIAGDMAHPLVSDLTDIGHSVQPQQGGGLGERLQHAVRGPHRVIAVGADCVCFSADWIVEAAQSTADVTLGPADDGGYWAIGVTPPAKAHVFTDIDWSTDRVYEQTMARARGAGLSVHRLPACYDIDRPEDLPRLLSDARCPPRTAAVLRELGAIAP